MPFDFFAFAWFFFDFQFGFGQRDGFDPVTRVVFKLDDVALGVFDFLEVTIGCLGPPLFPEPV